MAFGQGVKQVTGLVARFATSELEQQYELWKADDDDVNDIAGPASRIAWRRLPEDAKGSDTLDILQLVVSLGVYVAKNLQRRQKILSAYTAGHLGEPDQVVA